MVWSRSPRLDALGGGRAPGELGTWAWWDEGIGGTNATNSSGSGQTPDDWGAFPHMDLLAWSYFGLLAVADAFVFILIVAALGGFLRVLCDRSPRIARASMGAKPSATRKAAHKRTPSSKRRRPKARRGEVAAAPDVEAGATLERATLERATLERATLERAPLSLDRGLIPSVPLSLVATSADAGVRVLEDGAARAPPPHTGVSEPVRPARAAWPPSGGGGSGGGSGGGGGGGGGGGWCGGREPLRGELSEQGVTVLVPCYLPNEQAIILGTVEHILKRLQYPGPFTVIVCYNTPRPLPLEADLLALDG